MWNIGRLFSHPFPFFFVKVLHQLLLALYFHPYCSDCSQIVWEDDIVEEGCRLTRSKREHLATAAASAYIHLSLCFSSQKL